MNYNKKAKSLTSSPGTEVNQGLRREKLSRLRVGRTHEDIGAANTYMLRYEAYLDCLLHHQALTGAFSQQRQIAVAWDPSSYAGKEVLVAAIYSSHLDKTAWLLSQELNPVMVSDLDAALMPLAKASKLKRVAGYSELRGLSASLRGVGDPKL